MLLCPMSSPQMMTILGFLSAANVGGPPRNRHMTSPHSARDSFRFRMMISLRGVGCFRAYQPIRAMDILNSTRGNMSHSEDDSCPQSHIKADRIFLLRGVLP